MKINLKLSGLVVASVVTAAVSAIADGKRDFYVPQAHERYFNQAQNARTFGMAGSSVATSSDSSSVVGNPAGLGMMEEADVSVSYGRNKLSGNEHPSYAEIERDEDSGSVLLALPVGPTSDGLPLFGNIGLGWTGYQGDTNDSQDTETRGYRLNLAYAKSISDSTSVGYGLAYFNDDLNSDLYSYNTNDGFSHTFGVQHAYNEKLSVGATAFFGLGEYDNNIYNSGTTNSDTEQYGAGLGAGYKVADRTLLTASADYAKYRVDGDLATGPANIPTGGDEEGDVANFRLGVEQTLTDWLSARAGYRYAALFDYDFERPELAGLVGSAKYNAWTLGAGVKIPACSAYTKTLNLDYGVEYRAGMQDDWQHLVTASLPFKTCK